ncbi:MAG: mucoidy inhibitor MuiA family protein [Fibrobacteres bacterium]|nr:mucoidy inhibitor MuiA family protein [Fibrobacterota bacterium]
MLSKTTLLIAFTYLLATGEELKTKITTVTVYNDRAQVTRTGTVKLTKGEQILELKGLPETVEPTSLQVSGTGNGTIRDVTFKREHLTETQDQRVKALLDEKVQLEEQVSVFNGRVSNANSERRLVEEIARKITGGSGDKTTPVELSPEKWIKMVEFYRSRLDSLDREIRGVNKSLVQVHEKISKIQNEYDELGRGGAKRQNTAEIKVLMSSDASITVNVSYIVYGPSWRPQYDLRLSTDTKKMNLSYMALIRQNTSEDWDKAVIKLSTAQPQIGGELPVLQPWRVDIYRPPVYSSRPMKKMSRMAEMAPLAEASEMAKAMPDDIVGGNTVEVNVANSMTTISSSIEGNAVAVSFVVPGENSIAGDNQEHKVTVATLDFPAEFSYSTVPKLSESAYLRVKISNSSEYPLLSGESNIFLDNNYISRSSISFSAPGEEFWISAGTDPGIKVEYKLIKKYESQAGVFSKKTKYVYEYILKVSNKRKNDEQITIQDQYPISSNQEVKVELIEPKISGTENGTKVNDLNIIEWKQLVKGGATVEIPLKFSVEYPKGEILSGMGQ